MKIKSFEDIEAWQKARVFTIEMYKICKSLEKEKEFGLANQIKRSAVSIMANIAEGFARKTNKEFIQFLFIAKGSAAELQSHLYLLFDLKMIEEHIFLSMKEEANVIQKMLSNFIKYLKTTI